MKRSNEAVNRFQTGLLAVTAVTFVILIIAYPDRAFSASLTGLTVWWKLVFPALLPFIILSELLIGFGVVHAVGAALEPFMRFLFRMPGASGWAVAMSMAAGFPAGAKTAADLRKSQAVSRAEGERMLAVSHISSPIFITSVIAAGFLNRPELGLPLIAVHLLSALLTGVLIGRVLYPPPREEKTIPPQRLGWGKMISVMAAAHRKDGRTFGKMLGDAVGSGVQSLLVVGGFMIVFSVLLQLLSVIGIFGALRWAVQAALLPFGMPASLADGAVTAIFEFHLGAYSIGKSGEFTVWGAAILSALIGWGGLSVHAQVKSLISGTDLRFTPFAAARLVQAAVSFAITLLLWNRLTLWVQEAVPAAGIRYVPSSPAGGSIRFAWPQPLDSLQTLAGFVLAALSLSAVFYVLSRALKRIFP